MIECSPDYLRSQRTQSAAQVAENARKRASLDLAPADRLDMMGSHVESMAARH